MATDGQTMTGPGLAPSRPALGHDLLSPSRFVRGACPSLARPMPTGDGLLVRLRPSTPGLTIDQFRQFAAAAARHGNGLIEVTARGNLQLRGLSSETMPALEADIAQAGIVPDTGLTIETPPLSGRDPSEIVDARAMAARLRQRVAALPAPLSLAPKLTIVVDGGGLLTLDAATADLRLMAEPTVDAMPRWLVSVGGTRASATTISSGSGEHALEMVVDLLKALDALGPRARGRDLAQAHLADRPASFAAPAANRPGPSAVGIHRLGPETILGLRLAFGQIHASDLIALLKFAETQGVDEIRTAPDHALLLLGASAAAMQGLQSTARNLGFWSDVATPASHIATCSGAGACASATYRTKALAAMAADWGCELLDGSVVLHLSGCPKGCAHPAASAIAVVGLPTGFGIVVDGRTTGRPAVVVDEDGLKAALQRVALLVGNTKDAGESAGDCLTRLGSAAIIAALRQE